MAHLASQLKKIKWGNNKKDYTPWHSSKEAKRGNTLMHCG